MLPTYSRLKEELCTSSDRLRKTYGANQDPYGLLNAIAQGDKKLEKYFKLARESDLMLISSGELSLTYSATQNELDYSASPWNAAQVLPGRN